MMNKMKVDAAAARLVLMALPVTASFSAKMAKSIRFNLCHHAHGSQQPPKHDGSAPVALSRDTCLATRMDTVRRTSTHHKLATQAMVMNLRGARTQGPHTLESKALIHSETSSFLVEGNVPGQEAALLLPVREAV